MSKKFVPPKLDMGPDFATASSIKAKHKGQSSRDVTIPSLSGATSSAKSTRKIKGNEDKVALNLINLSQYFDWRRGQFDQSPTLYKIACIIWLYLPV